MGGGGGGSAGLRTIGLKSFCCRLPLACGAVPCVRRFWEVGSSHLPGRCSRPPLPRFSRHLTRRGGGQGRGACRHHPRRRTHSCARRACPKDARSQPARPPLLTQPGSQTRGCWPWGASFRRNATGCLPRPWKQLLLFRQVKAQSRAFKTPVRTRFLPGSGKGELWKRQNTSR